MLLWNVGTKLGGINVSLASAAGARYEHYHGVANKDKATSGQAPERGGRREIGKGGMVRRKRLLQFVCDGQPTYQCINGFNRFFEPDDIANLCR